MESAMPGNVLAALVVRPTFPDVLQSEIRKICGLFSVAPPPDASTFKGSVTTRRLGCFDAVQVAISGGCICRDGISIRRAPRKYLHLVVQDHGNSVVEQERKRAELDPGDIFLVDPEDPLAFTYTQGISSQISMHIPRDRLISRCGTKCLGGVSIRRHDSTWRAIHAVIEALVSSSSSAVYSLSDALLSLLVERLTCTDSQLSLHIDSALLSHALALIDAHYSEPDFGPRILAERLHVSERTLQRHFQRLNETPGQRLLHTRLSRAHEALSQIDSGRIVTVTQVAYDAGFNDLSYFSREFRKRYGKTPGAIAREACRSESTG